MSITQPKRNKAIAQCRLAGIHFTEGYVFNELPVDLNTCFNQDKYCRGKMIEFEINAICNICHSYTNAGDYVVCTKCDYGSGGGGFGHNFEFTEPWYWIELEVIN